MIAKSIVVMVLALAVAGCNTSYNYFEEEADASEGSDDTTAFGSILSMTGMVAKPKPAIQYRQRAPLAMPSTTELPTPEDGKTAQQAVNFPVDADDAERKRQQELAAVGAASAYERNGRTETGNVRVNPGDQQVKDNSGRRYDTGLRQTGSQHFRLTREQMRQSFKGRAKEGSLLTEEGQAAPRAYLIQPPEDYRTPADTAAVPDPGDIENSEWAKRRLYKPNDRRPPRMIKE